MREWEKKISLGAMYGMGKAGMMSKRWDDMKCIGGTVTVTGNKFSTSRKLFMKQGAATGLLYVKTARERFSPLCVDGTLSNDRTWSKLELPKTHVVKAYDAKDGGHVEAHDIVLMARHRVMGTKPEDRTTMSGRILR